MSKVRAPRRSKAEQLQLITECRQSGLADAEWCRQHDIRPSTFYSWVNKLRRDACDIPTPSYGHSLTESGRPDVVKVDIVPEDPEPTALSIIKEETVELNIDNSHTIEIEISGITVKVSNQADPVLLAQTIRALKGGGVC